MALHTAQPTREFSTAQSILCPAQQSNLDFINRICFAQLIVKNKRYGVKSFVVPLRDSKDFSLLPGISIGDLGKKMGRDGIDNGWIQFTNVRIPRTNLLMKHTKVSRQVSNFVQVCQHSYNLKRQRSKLNTSQGRRQRAPAGTAHVWCAYSRTRCNGRRLWKHVETRAHYCM